jgi:Fe-S cluster assembly scaffold protein SufB
VEHEASTSKIGEDQLFYFQQRGIDAEEAVGMIISGFCSEVQDEGLALDRVLDLNCVMDSVCWRNDAVDGVSALRRLRQVH